MKRTIKSLLIMGLLTNITSIFSGEEQTKNPLDFRIIQSYQQIKNVEQRKRNLRYGAAGLGLVGIGWLMYHSWTKEEVEERPHSLLSKMENGTATIREKIVARNYMRRGAAIINDRNRTPIAPVIAAPVLPKSTAIRKYIVSTVKSSFFGLTTLGTTIAMMTVQGMGAGLLTKAVLSPLATTLLGTYSMTTFIASRTKLNQNIKDIIRSLAKLNNEELEDTTMDKQKFDITFKLIERDMFNILGFMRYIFTLIDKNEKLVLSKAVLSYKQVRQHLLDLQKLYKNHNLNIDDYKKILCTLVDQCESFMDVCEQVGTDFMEDYYVQLFAELKQSINIDKQDDMEEQNRLIQGEQNPQLQALMNMIAENGGLSGLEMPEENEALV